MIAQEMFNQGCRIEEWRSVGKENIVATRADGQTMEVRHSRGEEIFEFFGMEDTEENDAILSRLDDLTAAPYCPQFVEADESEPVRVVLSTPLLIGEGTFRNQGVSLEQARHWCEKHSPQVFTQHETVKVLGIEPAAERKSCTGYDEALVVVPAKRLEFGREYTLAEIEEIGVTIQIVDFVSEPLTQKQLDRNTQAFLLGR